MKTAPSDYNGIGRRVETARGLDDKKFEIRIPDDAGELPWVPIDERFTLIKEKSMLSSNALPYYDAKSYLNWQ